MEYGKNRVMTVQAESDEPTARLTVCVGDDVKDGEPQTIVMVAAPLGSVDRDQMRRMAESAIDVAAREASTRNSRRASERLMRNLEGLVEEFNPTPGSAKTRVSFGLDWGARG